MADPLKHVKPISPEQWLGIRMSTLISITERIRHNLKSGSMADFKEQIAYLICLHDEAIAFCKQNNMQDAEKELSATREILAKQLGSL